jgi:hypothetical protein
MTLSVKKPSPVSISVGIKSVALVDRSQASQANRTVDAIHKTLSLESSHLQMDGVQASLEGLSNELIKNNRFTQVVPLTSLQLFSTGAGLFPYPLSWDSVQQICKNSHTDALFSLELFDVVSKVNLGANPLSIVSAIRSSPVLASVNAVSAVDVNMAVKIGWRIYDPSTRTILDEYIITRDISQSASILNPAKAVSFGIKRNEAVKEAGNLAGQSYADRIQPYWIRVSRNYFVRGDNGFIVAKRKAQAGDWDGAGDIWNRETTSTKGKIAGRACYNMAISDEINGDLDGAIRWASKAYEDYNVRIALRYINILRYRKNQFEILKTQDVSSNTP